MTQPISPPEISGRTAAQLERGAAQPQPASRSLPPPAWLILALFALAALLLRLPGIDKSIWLDEAFTLQEVYAANFFQTARTSDHPPLYSLLLRGWAALGAGEAFLRLPSVLFGAATVLVLVLLLLRYSRSAAVVGGAMAVLSPSLLHFSQEIRGYALLMLFTALALLFADRLQRHPQQAWAYLGLSASLAGASVTHLVGIFLVPALAAFLACHYRRFTRRSLLPLALAFSAPVLLFAGYYLFFLSPIVRARSQADWGYTGLTAEVILFSLLYLIGFFSFIQPLPALMGGQALGLANPVGIVLFIALLLLITSILTGSWRRGFPFFPAALVYWGGMLAYSLVFGVVILNERTVMPGLIPLIAFVALQLTGAPNATRTRIAYGALGVLCLAGLLNWLSFSAFSPAEDWRSLSAELSASYQPGDTVLLFPGYAQAALAYYTPRIHSSGLIPIATDPSRSPQQAADITSQLASQAKNTGRAFFIYREDANALADPSVYPALRAALEKQFGPPTTWQAGRLALHRYGE